MAKLHKYIKSKKDLYGGSFKKDNSFGFDYISSQGAVKIKNYEEVKPPIFKKI